MTAFGVSTEALSGTRRGPVKGALGATVRHVLAGHREGERPAGKAIPAVAVLGRSNVGKSSLLNALLGVKVARVSQTPGRTQALYWYRVDERFDLVDCPGYGYAKTAKEKRAEFATMIEALLSDEPKADLALLLVDGRLEPQASDLSMSEFLRLNAVPTLVAATKWDAVKPSQRVRRLRELARAFEDPARSLLPVSSETGENLRDLAHLITSRLTKESN
jgi:GTP-binding protein